MNEFTKGGEVGGAASKDRELTQSISSLILNFALSVEAGESGFE